ncbi:MAG: hypothetical protein ACOC45_09170 [Alkalispirochaetaceae bacterium]
MRGSHAFVLIMLLTIAVVLVPYLIIGQIPKFSASYLYWTVIPVITLLIAVYLTRGWSEDERRRSK